MYCYFTWYKIGFIWIYIEQAKNLNILKCLARKTKKIYFDQNYSSLL